jgi:hypothetical protein
MIPDAAASTKDSRNREKRVAFLKALCIHVIRALGDMLVDVLKHMFGNKANQIVFLGFGKQPIMVLYHKVFSPSG